MSVYYLTGAPAGLALTARLRDGDEILPDVVTVAPLLDAAGDPLDAYTATFSLPAALPVLLEWLDVGLAVVGSELVAEPSTVPAPGTPWFTIGEARALKPLDNATKYPDAAIELARAQAQQGIEDACGVEFTPAAFSLVAVSRGADTLYLRPRLVSVDSVSLAGVVQSLTGVELGPGGIAYRPLGWPVGRIVVTGTAGYPAPPLRVKQAALALTRRVMVDSPINDRMTSLTTPDGATERFITAGVRDALFDVPEVNAVVELYGLRDSAVA